MQEDCTMSGRDLGRRLKGTTIEGMNSDALSVLKEHFRSVLNFLCAPQYKQYFEIKLLLDLAFCEFYYHISSNILI